MEDSSKVEEKKRERDGGGAGRKEGRLGLRRGCWWGFMDGKREGQGRLLGGGHRDEHAQLVLFPVRKKKTRQEVGLGYKELGQVGPATSAKKTLFFCFLFFFYCLLFCLQKPKYYRFGFQFFCKYFYETLVCI